MIGEGPCRALFAVALLVTSVACGLKPGEELTVNDVTYQVLPELGTFGNNPEEGAALNPAVVEELLSRPELPFNFGSHDRDWPSARDEVTKALTPALNKELLDRTAATLFGEGYALTFMVSKRAGLVMVVWWGDRGMPAVTHVYDVSQVPGAFDPKAKLEVETVRKRARFFRGDD